jgi:VCBS repeat-containing protein
MLSNTRRVISASLLLALASLAVHGHSSEQTPAPAAEQITPFNQGDLPALIGADAIPDLLIGQGNGGGMVRVLNGVDYSELGSGFPFGGFIGGVRVAAGDVNGDGVADVIVGQGHGGAQVRVFNGATAAVIASFDAFGNFANGVHVAAGDINNDGYADVVVGSGTGGLVRVFSGLDRREIGAGYPFGTEFPGGVTVALADVTADGQLDYITGTALGGLVRVFDGRTTAPLGTGFPYGPLYFGGISVAGADVTGDGRAEVITGALTAASPEVRVFNLATASLVAAFLPHPDAGGVTVAAGDLNGDGFAEIITGAGPGAPPRVRIFNGLTQQQLLNAFAFAPGFTGGIFVATTAGASTLRFTSATATTFNAGSANTFTITTTGAANPPITLSAGTLPTGVTLTDHGNGTATLAGNPPASAAGTHALTFRAGLGTVPTQVFTLTIDDVPVAANDAYTVNEGATLTVPAPGVVGNDTNVVGTPLTASLVSGPAQATFTLNPDGSFTYTHNGSETVTDTFTYRINDTRLTSNVATVTITITPQPDPPVATNDAYSVAEGGTLTIALPGVLGNDTDPDSATLTAALGAGPAQASAFTLNADGSFTYTHNGSETTTDSFTYRASDGGLSSEVATVAITITPVNDAPAAVNDAYSVNESATLAPAAPGVLGNDTDAEASALTAVLVSGPAHAAAFTLNANGSFSYTHNGSETPLADSFTYRANDGALDSNIATVTITIVPVNDAPVAGNDSVTVAEGGTLTIALPGVLANDTDADSAGLTAVLVTGPAQAGAFTLNADGSFTYTHNGSETLTDNFTYRANDGALDSNLATVTITVTAVNDAPTALPDSYGVNEGGTLTTPAPGVLANDTDPDGTVVVDTATATLPANGTLAINADGSFTYTHNGSETATDSFTYRASDGALQSNVATVTITITPVNDAPALDLDADDSGGTTGAHYAITFPENAPATLLEDSADATLTDADSPTLATLTVTLINLLDAGQEVLDVDLTGFPAFTKTYDTTTTVGQGILTIAGSGGPEPIAAFQDLLRRVTYRHTGDNPTGAPRVVTFSAFDGTTASNTATSTVTVTVVNDAPVATDDSHSVLEGGTLTITAPGVLGNDTDGEGSTLTATLVTPPAHHVGAFTLNADGSFSYTHDGSETTTDSFTYLANDGVNDSNVATVTITITPVNDVPVAADDPGHSLNEGATLTVLAASGVLANDTDAELTPLTAQLVTGPAHAASFALNPDGSFTYQHDGSETPLIDSFTYRAFDGTALSNIATVTLTITAVNDGPVVDLDADDSGGTTGVHFALTFTEGDAAKLIEDDTDATITDADGSTVTSLTVTLTNLLDPTFEVLDVDLTGFPAFTKDYDVTTTPGVGVLLISAASAQPIADLQTLLRRVSYVNTDQHPDATARVIAFVASDGTSGPGATTTVTIVPVNDPPTADNDAYSLTGGGTLNIAAPGVLDGDLDPEGATLTAVLDAGPAHATSFALNPDGSFTYVHDGTVVASDSFTYHAHDGALDSTIATVTITFNAPPDAVDDTPSTNEDTALNPAAPGLMSNDTDPDDPTDTRTIVAVNGVMANVGIAITTGKGASLTVQANGSYVYNPTGSATLQALPVGQSDTDTFTYTIQDAGGLQDTATVTVTVNGVNDTPAVTTTGGTTAFTEDGGAVVADGGITVTDVDAAPVTSATITITNLLDGTAEALALATPLGGATANYTPATGVLLISGGTPTVAEYQTMLRAVTYNNTSQNPSTTSRVVSFKVNDGTVDSNTANKTVTVAAVNDAPTVTTSVGTTAFTENGGAVVIDSALTVTDPDHANLTGATVTITNVLDGGAEVLSATACGAFTTGFVSPTFTISGTQSVANFQACLASVRYNNTSDNPNTTARSLSFAATDGVTPSAAALKSVSVTAVNDPPLVQNTTIAYATAGNTQLHVEGKTLAGVAFIADATGADTKIGTVTDPDGPSAPAIVNNDTGTSTNGGSFDIDTDGSFTYLPPLNFTGTDSFTFQVSDGLASTPVTVNVTVTNVVRYVRDIVDGNNPAGGDGRSNNAFDTLSAAVTASTGNDYIYVFAGNTATTPLVGGVSLANGTKLWGQGIDLDLPGFADVVTATTQPRIRATAASTNAVNVSATAASLQNIEIRGLDLEATGAAANAIDLTSSGAHNLGVTIGNVTVTGATAEGIDITHGSTSTTSTVALSHVTVTSTGTGVDINQTTGLLTITSFSDLTIHGDSGGTGIAVTNAEFDATPGTPYNPVDANAVAVGASGNPVNGPGVVLTNVTGDLAFDDLDIFAGNGTGFFLTGTAVVNAAAGTGTRVTVASGSAELQSDNGPVVNASTATLGLVLSSATVIDSTSTGISLTNIGDGDSAATFSAAAGSIAGTTGASIAVSGGNATISYGGSITQTANAALLSVSGGHVDTLTLSGNKSATAGTGLQFDNADGSYTLNGTTTLNGGDAGIDILNGSDGTFSFAAGTAITNPSGDAFTLTGSNATVSYSGSITDNSGFAVNIDNHETNPVTFSTGNITSTGTGIQIANSNSGTITFTNPSIDLQSGANAAVTLSTNAGSTINFAPAGGNGLDIVTTSGTGFTASGGTITVQGTGNSIGTQTGTALVLNTVTVGNGGANGVQFNSLTTNGAANGILLTNVGQAASSTGIDILGGSITNAATRGVDLSGVSADVNSALPITSTATGRTVEVTDSGRNVAGGSQIVFSGAIDENGLGINLDNNDQNAQGAVITFSGGLDIDSTTNSGFTATNGGAVNVTGTNTIDTTTGTALNVTNTTIGVSGLTFQSISSNGGANGIVLNTTGATAGLTVTGDGGSTNNGSGGTIQNKVVAISLTSTRNVSLDQLNISTTSDSGINGTTVTNFSYTNGTIAGAGNSSFDSAIAFNGSNSGLGNNIAGTLTVTGNTFTNPFYSALDVQSDNGTVTSANLSNNTITNPGFSGINLVGIGSATTAFSLNDATINQNNITSSGGNGIQVSIGNGNTGASGAAAVAHAGFVTIDGSGRPVSDPSNIISITSNLITIDDVGTQAITVANTAASSAARTQTNFEILNNGTVANPLDGSLIGTVILIGNNGFSDMAGVVHNNVLDANHTPGDAGGGGNGIGGGNGTGGIPGTNYTPRLSLVVTSNDISDTNGNGILLVGRSTGSGNAYLKIANNIVDAPNNTGGSARDGIRVDAGNSSSVDDAVYLNIFGNTSAGSNGSSGIGVRKQGTVATTNDFGIFDAAGGPVLADNPSNVQVEAFLAALNPASAGGALVINGSAFLRDTTLAPPLMAANGQGPGSGIALLNIADAERGLTAALKRFDSSAHPITGRLRHAFSPALASLGNAQLGAVEGRSIVIDTTAAGWGWFVDPTPDQDEEFEAPSATGERIAKADGPAAGKIDLLSVIMHELGHARGDGDLDPIVHAGKLMAATLPAGVRRGPMPAATTVKEVGPSTPALRASAFSGGSKCGLSRVNAGEQSFGEVDPPFAHRSRERRRATRVPESAAWTARPMFGIRKQGTTATTNDFGIGGLSPSPATEFQTEDFVAGFNPGSVLGLSADGVTQKRVIAISGSNFVSCSSMPQDFRKQRL